MRKITRFKRGWSKRPWRHEYQQIGSNGKPPVEMRFLICQNNTSTCLGDQNSLISSPHEPLGSLLKRWPHLSTKNYRQIAFDPPNRQLNRLTCQPKRPKLGITRPWFCLKICRVQVVLGVFPGRILLGLSVLVWSWPTSSTRSFNFWDRQLQPKTLRITMKYIGICWNAIKRRSLQEEHVYPCWLQKPIS